MRTHVTFVLDSSGSMAQIKDDTVGGFNTFLDDQRDEKGSATVGLYDFDTNVDRVYQGRAVEESPELDDANYSPGGRTALHDAIVTAIDGTDSYLASLDAAERPDNVIIVVLTDGKENASETPQETVRDTVEARREEFEWEFLFIGANQDAALTAEGIGMDSNKSLNMDHSGDGAEAAYESTSERVSEARQQGETGDFNELDRQRQEEASRSEDT
jgi:hypothetical protein